MTRNLKIAFFISLQPWGVLRLLLLVSEPRGVLIVTGVNYRSVLTISDVKTRCTFWTKAVLWANMHFTNEAEPIMTWNYLLLHHWHESIYKMGSVPTVCHALKDDYDDFKTKHKGKITTDTVTRLLNASPLAGMEACTDLWLQGYWEYCCEALSESAWQWGWGWPQTGQLFEQCCRAMSFYRSTRIYLKTNSSVGNFMKINFN